MPRLQAADVLLPQALDVAAQRHADPGHPMWAFARLRPGMSIEQARAELEPLFQYSLRLAPAPFRKEVHLEVRSLRDRQIHDVHLTAWILLGLGYGGSSHRLRQRDQPFDSSWRKPGERAGRAVRAGSQPDATGPAGADRVAGLVFCRWSRRMCFCHVAAKAVRRNSAGWMLFLTKARIDLRILAFAFATALLCAVVFGLLSGTRKASAEALAGRACATVGRAPVATVARDCADCP